LGDHASPIESELLLAQRFNKRAGSATPELKTLKGKRIVWASETEEGRKFDVSKIKYYTGGGSIVARGLYDRRLITFEPSHTMFLITNPKPKAKGDDPAFWERVFLIPLTQRFVDDPKEPNEHKADIYLLNKLKAEAGGILAWLVRGCLQWQKNGLRPPAIVKEATHEYQLESDDIARFVEERCVRHPNSQVRPKILHETYQNWASENANDTLSPKTFFQKIKRFIDDEFRNKKGKVYLGLGLSETEFKTNLTESFGE
jgi:putative DNA primase/helicase